LSALPQTSQGELTVLLRPSSWILGGLLLREGREREERGPPLLSRYTPSYYILDKGLTKNIFLNIASIWTPPPLPLAYFNLPIFEINLNNNFFS